MGALEAAVGGAALGVSGALGRDASFHSLERPGLQRGDGWEDGPGNLFGGWGRGGSGL